MGFEMNEYFRGVGCKRCRNRLCRPRRGVHELFVIDDELRDAIVADPSTTNLDQSPSANEWSRSVTMASAKCARV